MENSTSKNLKKKKEKKPKKGEEGTDDPTSASFVSKPEKNSAMIKLRRTQRVLLVASRRIGARHRHLLTDFHKLMPHAKKESKLDSKDRLEVVNELAEMNNCPNILFFETRKMTDLYLWLCKAPHGPSIKFLVQNIHTMDELKMAGNCLKGSRPLLSFDSHFDSSPQYQLMKEMFTQTFGTPNQHPRSKPFFDHVYTFSICDDKIWFRNFQIIYEEVIENTAPKKQQDPEPTLIEIGPRMVLTPIRIFDSSMHGATLYFNDKFVSPNESRRRERMMKSQKYVKRKALEQELGERKKSRVIPEDELEDIF